SQTDPVIVTGGAQDNGSSTYDGNTGLWKDWLGADGMEGFVDKDNPSILYGTSQFGNMYRSTNTGTTYSGIGGPGGSGSWVTPFEQDPVVTNRIYVGYANVYRSNNSGGSWTAISQNFGGNLNELKIASSNNQVMYASRGSNLFKTTDGGATNWSTLSGFAGNINSIAIHPTDPDKVAIATTGAQKVYVSTDGGANWNSYLYNLPNFSALAVVWENNGNDGLYVGLNYGVFYIDNTFPGDWQPFSNNLPNVRVSELEINETTSKIYAGTYGRGLWISDAYDPLLSLNDNVFEQLTLYPNPASNTLNIDWNTSDEVSVKIFDINGKQLHYSKGVSLLNGFDIDTSSYANGVYVVRINTVNAVTVRKLIINK
ncbi:MAG: T9SS type A sorting domain-containing protein, partial [Flavobacteriaceae bacterium]|nr:T9SS type A sorting domain-containing protein [Flavobacteriaceae bacterium]